MITRFKLSLYEDDRYDKGLAVIHAIHHENNIHHAYMTVVVRMDGQEKDDPVLVQLAKDVEIALNKGFSS